MWEGRKWRAKRSLQGKQGKSSKDQSWGKRWDSRDIIWNLKKKWNCSDSGWDTTTGRWRGKQQAQAPGSNITHYQPLPPNGSCLNKWLDVTSYPVHPDVTTHCPISPHFYFCPPLIIIVSLQLSIYCHNSQRSIITYPSSAFYFVICECLNEKQHANKRASLGQNSFNTHDEQILFLFHRDLLFSMGAITITSYLRGSVSPYLIMWSTIKRRQHSLIYICACTFICSFLN